MSEVKTRADKIRAMDDYDLAWVLMDFRIDAYGKAIGNPPILPESQATIALWLKEPVEDE